MTIQHVPTTPFGCFLDYTYCGDPDCDNKCGRRMSKEIKEAIERMHYSPRISFTFTCEKDQ